MNTFHYAEHTKSHYEVEVKMTNAWMPYPGPCATIEDARRLAAAIFGGSVETRIVRVSRHVAE